MKYQQDDGLYCDIIETVNNDKYFAVIIAAGLSSRMGGFKPLLDVGGEPALFRLLDSICKAGIERMAVVTGYGREAIEAALEDYCAGRGERFEIAPLYNADFEYGMFGSVKAGIGFAAEQAECRAALLFPVDAPLVSVRTITGLAGAWELGAQSLKVPPFAVPVYKGKNGHPLLIPREYFDEILAFTGEGGLKGVRAGYDADMIRYVTEDAGCVLDMDTPEDYAKLIQFEKEQNR